MEALYVYTIKENNHKLSIMDLFCELKSTYGLSYLFITHDIKAAYSISDELDNLPILLINTKSSIQFISQKMKLARAYLSCEFLSDFRFVS